MTTKLEPMIPLGGTQSRIKQASTTRNAQSSQDQYWCGTTSLGAWRVILTVYVFLGTRHTTVPTTTKSWVALHTHTHTHTHTLLTHTPRTYTHARYHSAHFEERYVAMVIRRQRMDTIQPM